MNRLPWIGWTACVSLAVAAGCAPTGIRIVPVPVDLSLDESELSRDGWWVFDKIALIDVGGVIINMHTPELLGRGEHPVSLLVEKLEAAERDPRVKAVVLRINSPGGSVTASDIMHGEIQRFRQRSAKPVVAMMMDVAASGGYYLACACDEIIAQPTTVTGSIGVIMQTVEFSGALQKLGVGATAIKSGPNKDAGSPLRPLAPHERAIFQAMIDEYHQRFISVVDAGRPNLTREQVTTLADGRVYTGQQALEAGLIDRMGGLRDAIERAKALAGIDRARVVTYQRPLAWHPNIYAHAPASASPAAGERPLIEWPSWLQPGGARFMYLWAP